MNFVGRKKELELVTSILSSPKAELLIVYGRRRLGKSTLLKKALETQPRALYFQFFEESSLKNLLYFKRALAQFTQNELFESIQADSWFDYFTKISSVLPTQFTLVFDEFSYLIAQDGAVLSHFQRIYDEIVKPKKGKLILCGSSSSIMSDLMEYKSPLYGRRTASIHLEEFSVQEASHLLKDVSDKKELLQYYALFGGIPYYLEQINQQLSFNENFRRLFFEQKGFFHDEVKFLLKEEVREIRNYFAILQAIGAGKTKLNEIINISTVERSSVSKYIFVLEQIGIVKQIQSFFDKQNSKNKRYIIADFFLSFWFAVFGTETRNLLDKSVQANILDTRLQTYFGHAFEKICLKTLHSRYVQVGTYFRGVEIDILGKNGNAIDLFECKFRTDVTESDLAKLRAKIAYLPTEYEYTCRVLYLHKKTYDMLF